ncbi:MAG: metallophosphoesterase family protein [Chloroflexota bacterium]
MKTLVVSDVHGNQEALQAVLTAADSTGDIGQVWCLGDVVGYGPNPAGCIALLRERSALCIQGNHDAGAAGALGLDGFNAYAAEALRWTITQLGQEEREWLGALPVTLVEGLATLVHGTPREPRWDYLLSYGQAIDAWERTRTPLVLVGHSHLQFVAEAGRDLRHSGLEGRALDLLTGVRVVVNPGSVGQPRDNDRRAAYALVDEEAGLLTLHRAWYDVSATQRAMAEAGLPEALLTRLSLGR